MIAPVKLGGRKFLASTTRGVTVYELASENARVVWTSNLIRTQVGNLVYIPERQLILGAGGTRTGSPIVALDAKTGDLLWKSRDLECGFLWTVGDRLFGLSRSGELTLGIPGRDGFEKLSSYQVFDDNKVWSAPAVTGSSVIAKDQEQIIAFDLAD